MDKRHTVALIWGGRGYEKDVSRLGMENILPLIDKDKYNILSLHIEADGSWIADGKEALLSQGGVIIRDEFLKIDCAFPLLHGDFGEDGRVQGALDCASIPYVGCGTMASATCRDKYILKGLANSLSIPTLPCLLAIKGEDMEKIIEEAEEKVGYPAFVKPTSLGSSVGARGARNREGLISAIKAAFKLCNRVIIERCLAPKRELECGFLSVKGKDLFTKCGEILCSDFYSYEKKYASSQVKTLTVANIDEATHSKIQEYSRRLVRALGIRDISRLDFFLSSEDIYFNEINTMPGMTRTSLYQKMIEAAGVPEGNFVNLLIKGCLDRR